MTRIEDMTPEQERDYRETCIGVIYEFVDFQIEMEGAELLSLEKMSTADLALLSTAVDRWRDKQFVSPR